jgi:hypothetical protein
MADESIVTETVKAFQTELDKANSDALFQLNRHIDDLASLPMAGTLPQYNDSLYEEQPPESYIQAQSPIMPISPMRSFQLGGLEYQMDLDIINHTHKDFSFDMGGMTQDTINTDALFARAELTDEDSPLRFQRKLDNLRNTADVSIDQFSRNLESIQQEAKRRSSQKFEGFSDHNNDNSPRRNVNFELPQTYVEISSYEDKRTPTPFPERDLPSLRRVSSGNIHTADFENIKEMKAIPSDENSRGILFIIQ